MSLTTQAVSDAMKAIRAALPGALDTLRHDDTEYTGTAIPFERGEVVDESGAMFTITGGIRLVVSELQDVRPVAGDLVQLKAKGKDDWSTYVIIATRLDETSATMLVTYGERYDEEST